MKKKTLFLLALCLICTFFSPIPIVQAANNKIVHLKENKTYRYDLNGDKKKEKIKVICQRINDTDATIQVYINGKKFFSRNRYAFGAEFYLVDLNTKDKYKELLVHALSDSDTIGDFFALRYKGKNKKSIFEGTANKGAKLKSNTGQLDLYRFTLLSNTGKNKLYISADTPYSNFYFGSYYIKVPVAIKNGKLIAQKQSAYQVLAYTKTFVYQLKRSMPLYETASTGSNYVTCYSGSKFKVLELKPAEKNKDTGALYVKIKTLSGKKGWLYFPAYSGYNYDYLEVKPGWG